MRFKQLTLAISAPMVSDKNRTNANELTPVEPSNVAANLSEKQQALGETNTAPASETLPAANESGTPAQPAGTITTAPTIVGSDPAYEWNPAGGHASAKDALKIETSLPDGSSIVGYPALSDPDAEIRLYQVQPSSDPFAQKDLARLLPPGEIAIVVCGYYPAIHENEIPHKRNIGHAGLALGVERKVTLAGQTHQERGVMTINNPQGYLGGAFLGSGYGCFFIQALQFPPELSAEEVAAYKQNIVAMTALANTYIPFAQENFNGSDPLGIHNRQKVQEAGEKLLLAVYGDEAAQQWLRESKNTAYCAELVSAGINTGVEVILSQAYIEQLHQRLTAQQGEDRYPNLYQTIHDRITSGAFLQNNNNPNFKYVKLSMVPEGVDLKPMHERCPSADRSGTGLAFMYYDFADIAYGAIHDTYPRQDYTGLAEAELPDARYHNAKVAQIQVAAFKRMAAKFKELANLDRQTTVAFDSYVNNEVIPALEKVYDSDAEQDEAIGKLLQKGKMFTPTGPNGDGMFIPPDLYLMPEHPQKEGWARVKNLGIAFFPENLKPIAAA